MKRIAGIWSRCLGLTALTLTLAALTVMAASQTKHAASPKRAAPVTFNRDIRPILSDNCFACHGPDQNRRMAGLRLDVRSEAVRRGAIVPGKPDQSSLIARVMAKQPQVRMPPPSTHRELTPAQRSLLRQWIAEGAQYEKHWSFVPVPKRVALPNVKNGAWVRSPIDRFVLARLERERIPPSPPASRTDWLRRVTFDLTGLPPSPEEITAFLQDRSPQAHEKVVDRLLASPRYGERMAQPWLDVARYADSYGYQSDQLSPTWPYRDWTVWAFNSNLPYDQFIAWQLAGDLLPSPTRQQRLATAFNRLHRMTNEGGSVAEEWRVEGVSDRVHTFGMAFLGLTLECARCHDHKYDPISQRDYYALSAFFNSIDEHGLYDRADIVPTPTLLLPTPEQERSLAAARATLAEREREYAQTRADRETAFRQWLASPTPLALPDMIGQFDFERFDGESLPNLVPGENRNGARLDEVPLVEGRAGKAAQLDGENNVNFPQLGRFTRHTPFTIAFWMRDPRHVEEPLVVFQACSGTDVGPHGYDLMMEKGVLTARLFRHWPGNAIAVRTRESVPKDTWTHVAVTYDGSSRASGLKIYLNGRLAACDTLRDRLVKGTGQHTLIFGQRFRDRGFKGGQIDDLHIFTRALTPLEVAQVYDGRSLGLALAQPQTHEAALREYYLSALDGPTREAAQNLAAARAQVIAQEDAQFEIAVMEEMSQPRPTFVLARGQYDAPKSAANRVYRHTPSAILPFPQGLRRDRLGLAQWLTHPDNPLTARVAVNRLWAIFWGKGLVETAEDFGLQGRLPSHPELLDWLAREFMQSGWNVKALIRQIVLSSAYRQASAVRPDLRERDPNNILLARGPSHRLTAEMIRDAALYASGLLEERLGGPPVSPYQPGDLWRESNTMSPPYRQSVGPDLYRRSLYTVWKRTAPMPNMTALDAVTREVCVARRQTTNTPLQALVLLNDTQFVEAARVLAERALKEGGRSDGERIRFLFLRLASREPTREELQLLLSLYEGQRAQFRTEPQQADRLIQIGERKPDPALPPVELAAAAVVAQTILNLDAAVWKR
jgi:mono/diheme cytochrome c family protein